MSDVRVRFAPSPTGSLHVGNARTAILNWIFARHHGGKLVLRIEDTDAARSTKESESSILEDLRWLGIDWDEGPDVGGSHGPYRQSERTAQDLYHPVVQSLREKGRAYPCFCTSEELEEVRREQIARGETARYSGKCRDLDPEEFQTLAASGKPHVARFRSAHEPLTIRDLLLGDVSFEGDIVDDFILYRSNGIPSYNFAVVVDDAAMGITHVIRGNDHLSNTPKQVAVAQALGLPIPQFLHIPMIHGEDGSRLSKRDGATSVGEFREMGLLPDALVNFLSLLSWSSPSGDEILDRKRLVAEFDVARLNKSAARFDREKLRWMNGQYIRNMPLDDLAGLLAPQLSAPTGTDIRKIVEILQPRLEYLTDAPVQAAFMLEERQAFTADVVELLATPEARAVMQAAQKSFAGAGEFSQDALKAIITQIQTTTGAKGKVLWQPLRLALTGAEHGPDLKQVVELFGFAKCGELCGEALAQIVRPRDGE